MLSVLPRSVGFQTRRAARCRTGGKPPGYVPRPLKGLISSFLSRVHPASRLARAFMPGVPRATHLGGALHVYSISLARQGLHGLSRGFSRNGASHQRAPYFPGRSAGRVDVIIE